MKNINYKMIKKGDVVECLIDNKQQTYIVNNTQQKLGGMRFQVGSDQNNTIGWIDEKLILSVK